MDVEAKQQLIDELRLAEKMLDRIYQLGESRSAFNKDSVIHFAVRAQAAVRTAIDLAQNAARGGTNPGDISN